MNLKKSVRKFDFLVHTDMKVIKENRILDGLLEVSSRVVHGLAVLSIAAMVIAGVVSYTLMGVTWLIEILGL